MNATDADLNSTGNGSVSSEYPAPFSKSLVAAIILVLAVEILIGFPTNLRVCVFLYKRKTLRKVTHILLGNLSLIGALTSGVYMPLYLVTNVMDQLFGKPLHGAFCVARASSSLLFVALQTLTLVAMAIDRNDCVMRPFKRRITVNNVRKVVKGIWAAASLITAVLLFLIINYHYGNTCHVTALRKTIAVAYTLVFINFYLFGTVIIILATFVRIVRKLRSSPFAESNQNSEIQVTRYSFMVLFSFIISWLPIALFSIVSLLARFTSPDVGGIKALLLSLSNLNYVVNPFIHMNILRSAQRVAGPAKPRNEDKQKETPGLASIEEQSDMTAAGLAKPKNEEEEKETPGLASIEEQSDMTAAGLAKPRREKTSRKKCQKHPSIEEQSEVELDTGAPQLCHV